MRNATLLLLGFIVGCWTVFFLAIYSPRCNAGDLKIAIITPPPAAECAYAPLSIAVADGLADARRLGVRDGWEYAGAVFQNKALQLCVSPPATSRQRNSVWWAHLYDVAEYRVVAIFHTHPGDDAYAYVFSGVDARTACKLMVPSFIVTEDRASFRFDPGFSTCLMVERDQPNIVPGRFVGLVRP